MAKDRFEIVKWDLRTDKIVGVVGSASSEFLAKKMVAKKNDKRTAQEKIEFEFRWQRDFDHYKVEVGSI
jgi:hypothetical protein